MPEIPQYFTKSDKSKKLQKLINAPLYILSKLGVSLEGMTQRRLERMAMAYFSYQFISYQFISLSVYQFISYQFISYQFISLSIY